MGDMMEGSSSGSLGLLIDADPTMRRLTGPLVRSHGLELVQARSGIAAFELLEQVPRRFRLALVSLDMPDLSGAVILETLRLFRPDVATICLTTAERVARAGGGTGGCLTKPLRADELGAQITEALAGALSNQPATAILPEAVARAKATIARSASLFEAARELARGVTDGSGGAW